MQLLTPLDAAFLLAEGPQQPFHVGGLSLLQPPDGAGADFAASIVRRFRESTTARPPFNRTLASRFGWKYWHEAPAFDPAHHFVHLTLPHPGRWQDLLDMVSRLHATHLDRAYPLWRMYLIDGLADGRIATFSKIHHCVADGIASIRLMKRSLSSDPEESLGALPLWELGAATTAQINNMASGLARTRPQQTVGALQSVTGVARGVPRVLSTLGRSLRDYREHDPRAVSSFQAPACLLNQAISGTRRFAAQGYSMPRIQRIAKACDASVNDIVLSMCGAALRRYLQDANALPQRPLIAGVPVSMRKDDSQSGNQVGFALANLGTHLQDPVLRVQMVKASMDYNKNAFRGMNSSQLLAYNLGMLAPGLATLLPGVNKHRAIANVVISHVPGPKQDIYWQGCKVEGIYPASIVLNRFALNITLISRHDQIDFGLTGCRKTMPGLTRLLDHLDQAIIDLEVSLGFTELGQRRQRRATLESASATPATGRNRIPLIMR